MEISTSIFVLLKIDKSIPVLEVHFAVDATRKHSIIEKCLYHLRVEPVLVVNGADFGCERGVFDCERGRL